MRIALVSKSDASGGGASRVARQLAEFLSKTDGVQVHHWMGHSGVEWPGYARRLHGGRMLSLVQTLANGGSRLIGFPDFFTPELLIHLIRKEIPYDLYHLHDISATLSPLAVYLLSKKKSVIWTLHDCSAFTGGCLYPMDCDRYAEGCGQCPRLKEWPMCATLDFTAVIRRLKKSLYGQKRLTTLTPSKWMSEEAVRSGVIPRTPRVVNNCVDNRIFRPLNRNAIRGILELPENAFIVLLSSWSLHDKRKGVQEALAALKRLPTRPFLLLVGNAGPELAAELRGFDFVVTGYIRDDRLLAQYYAAADLMLFPTLADNLPNVVLETMSVGTPSVAFSVGGVPEMVEHDLQGWLAAPGDIGGLSEGLSRAMNEPARLERWREACLETASERFSCDRFLKEHLELYRDVLGKNKAAC